MPGKGKSLASAEIAASLSSGAHAAKVTVPSAVQAANFRERETKFRKKVDPQFTWARTLFGSAALSKLKSLFNSERQPHKCESHAQLRTHSFRIHAQYSSHRPRHDAGFSSENRPFPNEKSFQIR
jgi:hypothetical protein